MIAYNNPYGVLLHEYDKVWMMCLESMDINDDDELQKILYNRAITSRQTCLHLINKDIDKNKYEKANEEEATVLLEEGVKNLEYRLKETRSVEEALITLTKSYRTLTASIRIVMHKNTYSE